MQSCEARPEFFKRFPWAEHALGLILSLSKKIALSERAMRRVRNLDRWGYMGNDIRGKTVGIIGIGNIGTRLSELCRGLFGMTVLAYDPYLTAEQIAARGATLLTQSPWGVAGGATPTVGWLADLDLLDAEVF